MQVSQVALSGLPAGAVFNIEVERTPGMSCIFRAPVSGTAAFSITSNSVSYNNCDSKTEFSSVKTNIGVGIRVGNGNYACVMQPQPTQADYKLYMLQPSGQLTVTVIGWQSPPQPSANGESQPVCKASYSS